jgi:hypothetical protein
MIRRLDTVSNDNGEKKEARRFPCRDEWAGRGVGGGGGSTAAPKDTIKVRARESCEQSWSGTHHERSGKQGVYRNLIRAALYCRQWTGGRGTTAGTAFRMQEYQWLPAICTVYYRHTPVQLP